jgi:hypothetical protein
MGVGISMQIFNPKSQIQRRKTKIMDRIELKAFVAEENNLLCEGSHKVPP